MEKKRSQSKQTRTEDEITSTNGQANLMRMAHKIAWTRMNGRNDALNPFVETQTGQPASSESRLE